MAALITFSNLFSYAIPVLLVSFALSVPKFLETKFLWTLNNSTSDNSTTLDIDANETEWTVSLGVSDLRSDPDYIR